MMTHALEAVSGLSYRGGVGGGGVSEDEEDDVEDEEPMEEDDEGEEEVVQMIGPYRVVPASDDDDDDEDDVEDEEKEDDLPPPAPPTTLPPLQTPMPSLAATTSNITTTAADTASSSSSASAGSSCKFDVLITSYEVLREDLSILKKIKWGYMVVDEAHRLKNSESSLSRDVRMLNVDHMHLLTGTPIQNNTSELWSLLNLIDKKRFHSLPPFLETYGNPPTTNEQLEELQEALRPYLLGRKKLDVEASIAPIEEIVIWVELLAIFS